jgi:hypothetical protein
VVRLSSDKITGFFLFRGMFRGLLLFVALRLLKRASAGTISEKEYYCKPIMSVH